MNNSFGQYIRSKRKEHNLTLTQLAAKLNLDSANLSKIENGKRKFDEKRLQLLANCFDLDIEMLKEEYLSEIFAKKMYSIDCSSRVLTLAEEKVKYMINKNKNQK